jgi:FlaG/FlaF family flagellin (archaellin)
MKRRKSFNRNLKAVSPVISTIIIVAIAITMSIAVAYWLLGLGSSFTKFEKVEFTTAYVTGSGTALDPYKIYISVKNTGSASATIDPVATLYNGKPDTYYVAGTAPTFAWGGTAIASLQPGAQANYVITLPATGLVSGVQGFTSGMTLEITLHSTGGKDYPKVLTLP